MVSDIVFMLARFGSAILSFVTFLVGLAKHDKPEGETAEGEFNNLIVRLSAFALTVPLQLYLLFFFVKEYMQKLKETKVPTLLKPPSRKQDLRSVQRKKSMFRSHATSLPGSVILIHPFQFTDRNNDGESELTEADQNLKRTIRARKAKQVK